MFLPPASGGAQGPHGKDCTKAAPPKMPQRVCRAAKTLPSLGLECAEQQSCHPSVHPPALSTRLPSLRHPRTGHAAPGHTAQHSTLGISTGMGCSPASLLQTQQNTHIHRQQ